MPKRALDQDHVHQPAPEERAQADQSRLSVKGGLESPARRLQSYLGDEFHRDGDTSAERWSLRRTVLFVLVTCAVAWAAIFWAISTVIA